MQQSDIIKGIVEYIHQNSPQTYTSLHTRAMTKKWYTRDLFDNLIIKVTKHPQISSTVKGTEVYFKQKVTRPKHTPQTTKLPPYPTVDFNIDDCPFKVCMCAIWRTDDDDEIYNPEIHDHLPTCDSVRFSDEYKTQYVTSRLFRNN